MIQEEDQDKREIDGSESQVSLSSSTHENEAPADTENGYSDQFGAVRTINKTMDGLQQSRKFMTMTNSDMQSGKFRVTGSGTTLGKLEAYYEGPSRQRETARVLPSTKLPVANKVAPPLLIPLVDNGASVEESLTRIEDSMGERIKIFQQFMLREKACWRKKIVTDRSLVKAKKTGRRDQMSTWPGPCRE